MRLIHGLLALMLLCFAPWAKADIVTAPAANIQVSLMTFGPGAIYWERFGHDAIELRDTVSGEAIAFNWGVFDFDEKGFMLNFARGRMLYRMDAETTESDVAFYAGEGRQVTRQILDLDPAQIERLRTALLTNIRPENAKYYYDYYADNCSTRVRDALDLAIGGALKNTSTGQPGGMTYRQQTARLMSNAPWLMLGMDLGLGPYADQPLNAWQESFLPMVLQEKVAALQIDGKPLVKETQTLATNRLDPPPAAPPELRWPLLAVGIAFAVILLLAARIRGLGWLATIVGTIFVAFAGLAGLTMLLIWTVTAHRSGWANANLLLFNPLAWLLLPAAWRLRRDAAPSRFARILVLILGGAALVALLLHLVPGFIQQNLPWILLALPCWAALVYLLWRRRTYTIGVA
jgi:hypothetical protein